MEPPIDRVAVLGAGTMGHGIAEVAAIAGYAVVLRDLEREYLDDGLAEIEWSLGKLDEKDRLEEDPGTVLERIDATTDLETAVGDADIVVEAVPERLELKHQVFAALETMTDAEAVLATNTSSIPVTDVAEVTADPGRVVGLHFFNPPVRMDLVEVVHGAETREAVAERAAAWVESIGKTPIHVRKDVRGFVVNTVLGPYVGEAAWMVSAGDATVRAVDAAMVHRRDYPMGPFELADLTGIDVGYDVRSARGGDVPPVMAEKVEAGHLGRKTGRGYYDYEDGDGADYGPGDGADVDTLRIESRMVDRAASLVGEDVATADEVDTGVRLGLGFPEGICRRGDRIGLDVVVEKLHSLREETGEDRFDPHPFLVELVEAGRTGESAGAGFYEYEGEKGKGNGKETENGEGNGNGKKKEEENGEGNGNGKEKEEEEKGEKDRGGGSGAGNPTGDLEGYRYLNASLSDGLLSVEIDRPERLNALSAAVLDEIDDLFSTADADAVRCATVEGAGDRAFSAGADVDGFDDLRPTDVREGRAAFAADRDPAFEGR